MSPTREPTTVRERAPWRGRTRLAQPLCNARLACREWVLACENRGRSHRMSQDKAVGFWSDIERRVASRREPEIRTVSMLSGPISTPSDIPQSISIPGPTRTPRIIPRSPFHFAARLMRALQYIPSPPPSDRANRLSQRPARTKRSPPHKHQTPTQPPRRLGPRVRTPTVPASHPRAVPKAATPNPPARRRGPRLICAVRGALPIFHGLHGRLFAFREREKAGARSALAQPYLIAVPCAAAPAGEHPQGGAMWRLRLGIGSAGMGHSGLTRGRRFAFSVSRAGSRVYQGADTPSTAHVATVGYIKCSIGFTAAEVPPPCPSVPISTTVSVWVICG
ncbi:hypothetical protein EJ06DRAFT_273959 [Trichodelitschia bisporula]|uniref:Uncharacterized protein n=1 Tax=Trichodelitschia bisporula TaxID=703511 RepID=A0A6G1I5K6_9PEZI|nr:hypothetical protein EJ06DRAFT_273959 [Trichodelitschia bisporula]